MSHDPAPTTLVEVAGLAKSFGDHAVLRDVGFTVDTGSVTVLIGPSGSGKTTVLRSLNALEVPEAGRVRVDDVTVDYATRPGRRELARLRARSGMVFQAHNLFPHLTVLENVVAGPTLVQGRAREEAVAEARELLARVGLTGKEDAFPYQLSGGQQQRVGIVRALAVRPRLMLFDEPTSALDPEIVGDVLGAMKDLASDGWTMIVVTHEMRFARQVADQVLFMDGGVIVESGHPEEVLTAPRTERARAFLHRIIDPL